MDYRLLGRTGIKVSEIALGCEGFVNKEKSDALAFMNKAKELGINFIDLYSPNPQVRRSIGEGMRGERENWVLEAHICTAWKDDQYLRTRNMKEVRESFDDLLRDLDTDYIDVGMIHYIDEKSDLDKVFQGEIIEYALKLKKEGKIKAIGLSSHNPIVALEALKTGYIDVLLFSINPCYDMLPPSEDVDDLFKIENYQNPLKNIDPDRQKLYEYCERENIAITVMKAFGGGDLLDEKLSPFKVKMTINQCLHYCLTRPGVVSVMGGAHTIEELEEMARYCTASKEEKDFAEVLSKVEKHSFEGHCVYCGHCAPCVKGIDVASVNKFLDLCIAQGEVPETVREHYQVLNHHASECIACGACMKRCPFHVNIVSKMKQAQEIFGK